MPQPSTSAIVRCLDPACGHEINDHVRLGCNVLLPRPASTICPCLKTPNDIAYDLVFGKLTPAPPPTGWRPPLDRDWS